MRNNGKVQRIVYLDLLRIVSIFFMILLHVASANWKKVPVASLDWKFFTIYDGFARFCVPVFVMISGVLFLNPDKDYSYKKIKRNITHIVSVYFIWSAIYTIYKYKSRIVTDNFRTILKYFFLGHSRMWFLWMIIGMYMLVPFLRKITEDKKLVEAYLIMSFFLVSMSGMFKAFWGEDNLLVVMSDRLNIGVVGGTLAIFY